MGQQDFSNAVEEVHNEFAFLPGTDVTDSSSKTASAVWTNVDYQALDKKKADFQRELQQKKGVSRRLPRAELDAMITSLNVTDEGGSAFVSVADKESEVVARLLSKDSKFVQDLDAALGSVGGFSDLMAMTGPFDDSETANRSIIQRPREEPLRKTWAVRFTLRCHFDCVRAIVFHPVEAIVLSASEDATVKLWNLQKSLTANSAGATGVGAGNSRKGSQDFDPVYTFHGHSGPVLCMCLSPTGDYCYTGGMDKTVRCWMMPPPNVDPYDPLDRSISSEVLRGHDDAVWSLAFHSSDNRLISASADGTLKLWEPSANPALLATYVAEPDDGSPTSVDFMSSDLHHAVAAYSSGVAYIYDLEQAKTVLRFPPASCTGGFLHFSINVCLMCSEHFLAACSLSPINQIVCHPTLPITVTAHEDRTIRFFDNNSGQMIDCVVAHLDAVTCLSIDPNGLFLLSGSHDGSLRLWNIDSKTCLQETTAHRKKFDESLFSVAFHPSRPIIASAGADGLAKIFM
ncbi:striatin 3 [Trichuris trichiura]|uniref:Striatin 3 n=1 Tax=Trichuris trichiura TaxID=36087 RepID=A0A077ZFY1_TRITR|nr:striatin 3 [Trichuris trichiura]